MSFDLKFELWRFCSFLMGLLDCFKRWRRSGKSFSRTLARWQLSLSEFVAIYRVNSMGLLELILWNEIDVFLYYFNFICLVSILCMILIFFVWFLFTLLFYFVSIQSDDPNSVIATILKHSKSLVCYPPSSRQIVDCSKLSEDNKFFLTFLHKFFNLRYYNFEITCQFVHLPIGNFRHPEQPWDLPDLESCFCDSH